MSVAQPTIAVDSPPAPARPRSRARMPALALIGLRLLLFLPAVALAAMIAYDTVPDAHPDENMHIDAFRYFETHWVRPEPGSAEVYYSPMGWSRVFTGETVYLLYGKIGHVVHLRWPDLDPYLLYRFLNVALLAITLAALATIRCGNWFKPWLLGLFLVSIPQVPYLYGYANSDAFGLSASVLLFVWTATLFDVPPPRWRAWRLVMFWALFL